MPFKVTPNYVPNVIKWKQTAVGPDFDSQRHTVTVRPVIAPAGTARKLSSTVFFCPLRARMHRLTVDKRSY